MQLNRLMIMHYGRLAWARYVLCYGFTANVILLGILPSIRLVIRLRHEPRSIAHEDAPEQFGVDDLWHPTHFFQGRFEAHEKIVIERKSGLMWQASGSKTWLTYQHAHHYIETLNRERFAGYADWRLPTVTELMTLQEAEKQESGLCLNPAFDAAKTWSWTSDTRTEGGAWYVDYYFCTVFWSDFENVSYVRAVRP